MSAETCRCNDCCDCLSPIPNGATCATACRHVERCTALGFTDDPGNTSCSFIPSRFAPRITAVDPSARGTAPCQLN